MKTTSAAAPLISTHKFVGGSDDFRCKACNQPRSQHQDDGFIPSPQPHSVIMDETVHYGRPTPIPERMGFER